MEAVLADLAAMTGVPALGVARFDLSGIGDVAVTGLRRAGGAAATLDDFWHIGSCGKSITSAMIASLVGAGTLHFTDRLGASLPDGAASRFAPVTLQELLSHRAGLPSNPAWWRLAAYMGLGGDPLAASESMAAALLRRAPDAPPGTRFHYSNIGYGFAGVMASRAAGQSFEDLVRTHVIEPSGMKRAYYGIPPQDGSAPFEHRRLLGSKWRLVRQGARAVDDLPIIRPSGSVTCTLGDFAAYGRWQLDIACGQPNHPVAETHLPVGPPPLAQAEWRYGMGWFVEEDGRRLSHSGSTGGTFAHLLLRRDLGRGLAFVANGFDPGWGLPGAAILQRLEQAV